MRHLDNKLSTLVIVESPNKVASIKKIFKDLGYTNLTVKASIGHIAILSDDRASWKNTGIYPDKQFKAKFIVDPSKSKTVNDLTSLGKDSEQIILATDEDREGEAISYHIINLCKFDIDKCFRVTYHSITKSAVEQGLKNAHSLDQNLVSAAITRQYIDKLIGYGLSPEIRRDISAKSAGRCQSIGLKLIVEREQEIVNFKPETYYNLYLNFKKNTNMFKATYINDKGETRQDNRQDLDKILKDCKATNKYTIKDIEQKIKVENTKPPFTTATYQQEASAKLGLKISEAMRCAQKLFEGVEIAGRHIGIITYIRTDSSDMALDFIPQLESFIKTTYGSTSYCPPKTVKKDDLAQEGHEALRVTDPTLTPEKLSHYISDKNLIRVYKLIWQRTLASCLPPAKISETSYIINCGKHLFRLTQNELLELGYRAVYVSAEDQDNVVLTKVTTTFSKGELLENCILEDVAKQTSPKARYTEASLVKELQKRGIGRPSTYATIVETVLSTSRGYACLDGKSIVPTATGIKVINYLDKHFSEIMNFNFTRQLEESLDKIATGKENYLNYLNFFFSKLTSSLASNVPAGFSDKAIPTCPICNANMIIRKNRFGKFFYGCSNYPSCTGIVSFKS